MGLDFGPAPSSVPSRLRAALLPFRMGGFEVAAMSSRLEAAG